MSDMMKLPEGYRQLTQSRLWVAKGEGYVLHGKILSREEKKNSEKEAYYYEVLLESPCKVAPGRDEETQGSEEKIVAPGTVVCIDEFAGITQWKNYVPSEEGHGFSVYLTFLKKESIGQGKTMWRINQGVKAVTNVRANMANRRNEDIPF